ncbi:MAG: hypothetical protein WCY97_08565 [Methanothrix sp.]|jgi:hypothetical protein|nr:MAG: hypothetical protein APR56_02915 [Methanosaeta sp. SDB]MCP1392144.1 hypothetical protein [Methanothrix harundinacea]MDD3709621.1 hypothetical protein [Methanothrix sp.]MDD5768376.1 hypothetical protein [Methanothrix sp.]MDI9399054.1 hypothetical protein [Euryarchaeota archaeon]
MKQKYKVQIAAGISFLLAGIALAFLEVWPEEHLTPFCYLAPVGLALIIIPLVRHWRYGDEPQKDERTSNILTRGFVYSWHLTVGIMVALFVMDDAGVMTMTVQNTLALIILVATFSALIFQGYLSRKEASL